MFLCLKHMGLSLFQRPTFSSPGGGDGSRVAMPKGCLSAFFAGVQEASVVWGQPEGGDVSTPQHQGLSGAKGRGTDLLKFLCASPSVEALCCYLTFSPNSPAEKPPLL